MSYITLFYYFYFILQDEDEEEEDDDDDPCAPHGWVEIFPKTTTDAHVSGSTEKWLAERKKWGPPATVSITTGDTQRKRHFLTKHEH
jgi:hypothetical protein